MDDIAVIIVNWNTREDLKKCLSSLFAEPAPTVKFGVWVVDNASADGSVDMVRRDFPAAHLIANDDNLGYVKANNQAIAAAKGYRYVFLLNSDAYVESPATLDALVKFADEKPTAGIIGARVDNPDGTLQLSCRRFPTLGAGVFRNNYLGRLFPKNRYTREYLMGDFNHAEARTVDWVSGCAMFIREEMIDKIGALDERFFMYCEDVDICRRTWDAGYEVWYCPTGKVTHKIGASSDKNIEKMTWVFHQSWEIYDRKYHPNAGPARRLAVKSGLFARAAVRVFHQRLDRRRRERTERARKDKDHVEALAKAKAKAPGGTQP